HDPGRPARGTDESPGKEIPIALWSWWTRETCCAGADLRGPHPFARVDRHRSEGANMQTLEGQRVVVTGGSRGLGLGIVEALVARKAKVTVVARDAARLADVAKALGVATIKGDASDPQVALAVLRDVKPSVLVLSNGHAPEMAPIHKQTW